MRYLKLTQCDGIYDYIPLDLIQFGFFEIDEHEYRVEITVPGRTDRTLFEKRVISDIDEIMNKIMSIHKNSIITPNELF
jgi:hypothetical protein